METSFAGARVKVYQHFFASLSLIFFFTNHFIALLYTNMSRDGQMRQEEDEAEEKESYGEHSLGIEQQKNNKF